MAALSKKEDISYDLPAFLIHLAMLLCFSGALWEYDRVIVNSGICRPGDLINLLYIMFIFAFIRKVILKWWTS